MKKYIPLKVVLRSVGESTLEDFHGSRSILDSPESTFTFWKNVIETKPEFEADKETLVVILLDAKLRPRAYHQVALGSVNECAAYPREIFRPVIISAAYAFVLAHNHPSGHPIPSQADTSITRQLREGAALLQVQFLDHVIVGDPRVSAPPFYSFRDAGIL
jgi:DNA repair protein RadC